MPIEKFINSPIIIKAIKYDGTNSEEIREFTDSIYVKKIMRGKREHCTILE